MKLVFDAWRSTYQLNGQEGRVGQQGDAVEVVAECIRGGGNRCVGNAKALESVEAYITVSTQVLMADVLHGAARSVHTLEDDCLLVSHGI